VVEFGSVVPQVTSLHQSVICIFYAIVGSQTSSVPFFFQSMTLNVWERVYRSTPNCLSVERRAGFIYYGILLLLGCFNFWKIITVAPIPLVYERVNAKTPQIRPIVCFILYVVVHSSLKA
jgi:hypothetical protein